MSRFEAAENEAAIEESRIPYVLFAEFDFASGFVRLNSTSYKWRFNGEDFLGAGRLAGIGPVRENGEMIPDKLEFTLSGIPAEYVAITLTEKYHGRDARLWVGYVDKETFKFVADPQLIWEGFMDVMVLSRGRGSRTISLVCENRFILWNKASGWMYTDEHQRVFDPTDAFFNQVAKIQNKVVTWGSQTVHLTSPRQPPARFPRNVEP
jgi:hypothetical protein